MAALQDWVAVGAPSRAPGSPISLVRNPTGVLHVALSFRDDLRDHPMLHDGMAEVAPFAQSPGVPGVAPLVFWDRDSATFVYPIARGLLLSDLVHARRFNAGPHPPRAALELLASTCRVLHDATLRAKEQGLPSHGALDPWRIALHENQSVTVLGYGLPPVDVTAWLDEESDQHPGMSLRYFPPERVEDAEEDARADVYGAALCAAELLFGRPLLEGDARQVVDAILDGEPARRVAAAVKGIAAPVRELFAACVAPRREDRPRDCGVVADAAVALLQQVEGPSLHDLARSLVDTGGPAPFDGFDDEAKTEIIEPRKDRPVPLRPVPPPPVAEAEADAELPELRQEGRLIVARSEELSEQAASLAQEVADRAGTTPIEVAILRRAYEAAQRTQRAAESAAQAVALLTQDTDAAAARITLDLVRNAEAQATQANHEVVAQLQAIEHHQQKEAARAKALEDTRRRAHGHATASSDAAAQSDELVTELEKAQLSGALSARGCAVAVDHAGATAEQAHRQAEDAQRHAEQSDEAATVELAVRHSEAAAHAEERATAFLDDTQRAAEHARRLEAQARAAAISNARAASTAARLSFEEAQRALSRAEVLVQQFPDKAAEAGPALEACRKGVRASEVASTLTSQVAHDAEDLAGSSAAQAKSELAAAAVERTRVEVAKAVAAAEEVRAAVGAAGHVHAELSALAEQAEALLAQAKLAVARVDEEMDGLLAETGPLEGAAVVEQRADAQGATDRAKLRLPEVEKLVRTIRVAISAETAMRKFPELREIVEAIQGDALHAHEAISQTWEAAEIELVEVRRREAAARSIAAAVDSAQAHAHAAASLIEDARQAAAQADQALAKTRDEVALRLHQRALEIIGIAEFQAGEAAAAATEARKEAEPTEARAHAQTALSFFERISADLPEAFSAIEHAEQIAETEASTIARAREETAAARALVAHLAATAHRAAQTGREELSEYAELPEVLSGLRDLKVTIDSFDDDHADVAWAAQQISSLDSHERATEVLTRIENVSARARDRRRQVDVVLEHISRAIAAARADEKSQDDARETVAKAIDAVLATLADIQTASTRLDHEVDTHRAEGDQVLAAASRMHEAVGEVENAAAALSGLASRVARATTGAEAQAIAAEATTHRATAEQALEAAAEAETAGVAAAEKEARARDEATARRLEHAREEAVAAQYRMEEILHRVEAAFTRARAEGLDELAQSVLSEGAAQKRLEQANALYETLTEQRKAVSALVVHAAATDDPEASEDLTSQARAAVDDAAALVPQIEQVLTASVDLARTALVEVEAMKKVLAEIDELSGPARTAVTRAQAAADRVLGILGEAGSTFPSPAEAVGVRTVEAKVRASLDDALAAAQAVSQAAPSATESAGLANTQAILDGVRRATSRAAEAGDRILALMDEANEQLLTAQLASAHAVESAREAASRPARDASAAAKKAEAWLAAGRREARDAGLEAQLDYELAALARAVRAVARHALQAERAADVAQHATNARVALEASAPSANAAASAISAADEARQALDELRDRITTSTAVNEAIASQVQDAAEARARISLLADQAEATLRAVEGRIAKLKGPSREVRNALEQVRTAAGSVRLVAGRATASVSRARAARTQAAAAAGQQEVMAALEEAERAMQAVQQGEQAVLERIERAREQTSQARVAADSARRQEAEQTNRKSREARRKRELEARAKAAEAAQQRRLRVDRRKEERVRRGTDDPPTTSTMRALLGADKKPPRKGPRPSLYADAAGTEEGDPPTMRASGRSYQPNLKVEVIRGNHTGELPQRPRAGEDKRGEGLFAGRAPSAPRSPRHTLPPVVPRTAEPGSRRRDETESSDVDSLLKRLRERRG